MVIAEELADKWRLHLQSDLPGHGRPTHEAIIQWLLGEDQARFEKLLPTQLDIAKQAMDYRYRILQQRYLEAGPERAYKGLIQRLSSLFLIRNKIRTWIALSRDRQRSVVDVLQEVIQELLQNDKYMQQQINWIAQCTSDPRLRNALVLATTEEYCLRPIRNQPLLVYRFVNYLRRSQRGGMTQVPAADFIRLVSEEIAPDESEGSVSLLDGQAVAEYQDAQAQAEQQELRKSITQKFEVYLAERVDPLAAEWLKLYLQGRTQEAIAQDLNVPIKQVYRLREKVNYHAVRVFAPKNQPELVTEWLGR
ncbi:HetZ-related protein 2 [Phormidesmis priestleyi]